MRRLKGMLVVLFCLALAAWLAVQYLPPPWSDLPDNAARRPNPGVLRNQEVDIWRFLNTHLNQVGTTGVTPEDSGDSMALDLLRADEDSETVGKSRGVNRAPNGQKFSARGTFGETTSESTVIQDELLAIKRLREAARAQVRAATVVVEIDTPMQVDVEYPVALIIQAQDGDGKTERLNVLAERIPARSGLRETVDVARMVRAQIAAADFDVIEMKGDWQNVLPDAPTVWAWKLKPRSGGSKTVLFFLDQKIRTAAQDYVVPVENYPRSIEVEVGFARRVSDLAGRFGAVGGFVVGAIGVAVGLVHISEWWTKRRRRPVRPAQSSPSGPPTAP